MKKEKPNKGNQKTPPYSVTEGGTLLESMDKKIDQIAEGHVGLDQRLERLETEVGNNTQGLDKVAMNVSVLTGRVGRIEDGLLKVSKDLRETREELGAKIDRLDQRLTAVEPHR